MVLFFFVEAQMRRPRAHIVVPTRRATGLCAAETDGCDQPANANHDVRGAGFADVGIPVSGKKKVVTYRNHGLACMTGNGIDRVIAVSAGAIALRPEKNAAGLKRGTACPEAFETLNTRESRRARFRKRSRCTYSLPTF